MGWLTPTGANKGKTDTPISKSRWFDVGNARVNAEDKNAKHRANQQKKRDAKDEKLRNKKGGFWS